MCQTTPRIPIKPVCSQEKEGITTIISILEFCHSRTASALPVPGVPTRSLDLRDYNSRQALQQAPGEVLPVGFTLANTKARREEKIKPY